MLSRLRFVCSVICSIPLHLEKVLIHELFAVKMLDCRRWLCGVLTNRWDDSLGDVILLLVSRCLNLLLSFAYSSYDCVLFVLLFADFLLSFEGNCYLTGMRPVC